ncbi:sialate O-acetylesterase [Echinicola salinicaeni]|uniref:sialate O-acetylesterase n=1 Tax=Echinicola salinicaeni TaxID=2762757 RepID=UPI00164905B2|nr:sialate O-acetylesterase [Echinicola salinicaeni]
MKICLNRSSVVCLIIILVLKVQWGFAEVKLPHLISDGMVLQRDQEIRIWGWADAGEVVKVDFEGKSKAVTSSGDGKWEAVFPAMKAGGPYVMEISGNASVISLKDIWLGDVWICSGQSNMEQTMARVAPMFPDEIKNANNPKIRYFDVPDAYDFSTPQLDLKGGNWVAADQENIKQFSAVAYFFAQKVHRKYGIPIGLVNASVGGSPIQSWIRENELKRFPEDYEEAVRFQNPNLIKEIETQDRDNMRNWHLEVRKKDKGYADQALTWLDAKYHPEKWNEMKRLDMFPVENGKRPENGVYWFRKEFFLEPENVGDLEAKLLLGTIVDSDSTYINGELVGTTAYQYPPRRYKVPRGVLKPGKNILVVRVINERGRGGFVKDKPYQLEVGEEIIDLKNDWSYKQGAVMPPMPGQTFIRFKPLGLYNAMIAPLQEFTAKGVLWYQGESNAGQPHKYEDQMVSLIEGWRKSWGIPDLPFLFVQLPNFMAPTDDPHSGNWPELREAQRQTLKVPHTGMAVTIDVGEANDIHPLDKKTVGERLALQAFKVAYGEKDGPFSGPALKQVKVKGSKIILRFNEIGKGIHTKDGKQLKGFAVAGKGQKYQWVNAKIESKKVILDCSGIIQPNKVCYAWANNPTEANLINERGLPASPFEVVIGDPRQSLYVD